MREKKNGILMGRGMPRPYNNCDPIAEVTSTDEEQLHPIATATSTDEEQLHPIATTTSTDEEQLHPITAANSPAQGAATPPFLPLHSQLSPPPILHEPQNKTRLYLLHLKKNA